MNFRIYAKVATQISLKRGPLHVISKYILYYVVKMEELWPNNGDTPKGPQISATSPETLSLYATSADKRTLRENSNNVIE